MPNTPAAVGEAASGIIPFSLYFWKHGVLILCYFYMQNV